VYDPPVAAPRHVEVGETSAHFRGRRGIDYFALQDRLAESGAELNLWKFERYVTKRDTVVDFGCGTGALISRLPCLRRIGVEVNAPAREKARQRGIETFTSSAELSEALADLVISNHALEHTLHPFAELREMRRALKPGGKLVLWLPLDDWRWQRSPRDQEPDNHLYTWTPRLLGNLLTEGGFDVETVRVVTTAWRHNYVGFHRRLPRIAYTALTFATAVALRRRQLYAVARKP
jgi:SAM-dependent methyltransferase